MLVINNFAKSAVPHLWLDASFLVCTFFCVVCFLKHSSPCNWNSDSLTHMSLAFSFRLFSLTFFYYAMWESSFFFYSLNQSLTHSPLPQYLSVHFRMKFFKFSTIIVRHWSVSKNIWGEFKSTTVSIHRSTLAHIRH